MKCYEANKSLVQILYSTKVDDDKHFRINMAVLSDILQHGE